MPQEQREVVLRLLSKEKRKATATGNNAAWLCACGTALPLIGRSGDPKGPSLKTRVKCPKCPREYFVVPDGYRQARVLEVVEIVPHEPKA